jgi:hypothetical protein
VLNTHNQRQFSAVGGNHKYDNMKNNLLFSKLIHALLIMSFILPFFFTGCEQKEEITTASGNVFNGIDTSNIVANTDTSSILINESINTNTETRQNNNNNDESSFSEELSKNNKLLKFILTPNENTYTGFGTIVDTFPYFSFFSITISFIILLITFINKIIESNHTKSIVLNELISLIFLIMTNKGVFAEKKLYGFWITIILFVIIIIYDYYLLTSKRKDNINARC